VNPPILQIMADVMNCPVHRIEVSKSAALGAALTAAFGYFKHTGKKQDWKQVVKGFTEVIPGSQVKPQKSAVRVYDKFVKEYAARETEALR